MKNQAFHKRLRFALCGIVKVYQEEPSFRWQLFAGFGAYLLLAVLGASLMWWALFTIIISLVLGAELFNSALERLMDHLHPEIHPMIGAAKDCAAGAVLVFSMASVILLICFLTNYFYY